MIQVEIFLNGASCNKKTKVHIYNFDPPLPLQYQAMFHLFNMYYFNQYQPNFLLLIDRGRHLKQDLLLLSLSVYLVT